MLYIITMHYVLKRGEECEGITITFGHAEVGFSLRGYLCILNVAIFNFYKAVSIKIWHVATILLQM